MGGGEKYRDVHVRETAALQRLVVKPVPDSDGFQERVGRKVRPVFLDRCVDQGRKGYLGPVFSCVPCGKRESGNPTLRDCKILHKVKEKNKTLTGVAHNTGRSQQNTVFRKYQNLAVKREIA